MQHRWNAYYQGKQLAKDTLNGLLAASPNIQGLILKPSIVVGTRYTKGGIPIPIGSLSWPVQKLIPGLFTDVRVLASDAAAFIG